MEVIFATTNRGKFEHLKEHLAPFGISVVWERLELPESQSWELAEIAREKARFAFSKLKRPVLTLDSGFFMGSLKGFPGPYTKYVLATIGAVGIARLGEFEGNRRGFFENALCYFDGSGKGVVFESQVGGVLEISPRGPLPEGAWSELHRHFVPDGEAKTLAEFSREEFLGWKANKSTDNFAEQFAEWLLSRGGD